MKVRIIIIVILSIFLLSCDGESTDVITVDVIAVTPLQSLVKVGETIQFSAVAKDVDLVTADGITFTWSSSDPQAVSIDANGLATGNEMARDVIITATADGIESNDAVIHVAGDPASINIGTRAEAVVAGKSITLSGKILDELGTEVPDATITDWQSSDETVLTITPGGIATGISKGNTTVVAIINGLESAPRRVYVWEIAFTEDFSSVDTTTIGDLYFKGNNGMIWQINHEVKTDTSAAGPYTGRPAIVQDNGNPVLRLTEPSQAYFTNRQLLIMTYGNSTYDTEYMWPTGDGMLTATNFRVQMRIKGMDDPVAGTTAESLVNFTQYFSGAASPYYLVYSPGRNRVSAWFGASLAPGASIPDWGAMPQIDYGTWFNMVMEVFDGTMRTEVFTGTEPTGNWDYSYT
ncbi:MAG: Ig-like domain-containing protein, partial [Candidatus Marinimicrobia bacterium]|nr:Ig-like domain-containing protein [Candidatus Neomarinimicrobiota bacterium]